MTAAHDSTRDGCTDDIRIVAISIDEVEGADEVLDEHERLRASRFRFERDRRRYVAVHTTLRRLLGLELGVKPSALTFQRGRHGKPHLEWPRVDLRFNLSHSGDYALVALTSRREIGVDIEQHRPLDAQLMSAIAFSSSERNALARVPADQRLDAFYRGWTRKESFVKARGDGLFCPLEKFDVSLDEDGVQLLIGCRVADDKRRDWVIRGVTVSEGYSAAVTFESPGGPQNALARPAIVMSTWLN